MKTHPNSYLVWKQMIGNKIIGIALIIHFWAPWSFDAATISSPNSIWTSVGDKKGYHPALLTATYQILIPRPFTLITKTHAQTKFSLDLLCVYDNFFSQYSPGAKEKQRWKGGEDNTGRVRSGWRTKTSPRTSCSPREHLPSPWF